MSDAGQQASSLLRRASEDLYAASCLRRDPAASLWTIGFHAQQSVEKALKAVLMQGGIRYPFTHDLEALLKIVRRAELSLPPNPDELPYLTPFGTLFRYEDGEWGYPERGAADRLLRLAETTVAWAQALLGNSDAPPRA